MQRRVWIGLAAAAALLAVARWLAPAPAPAPVLAPGANVVEFTLLLADDVFRPAEITVQRGERVRLVLKNVGRHTHEFELEGYNFEIADIRPGQTVTVVFTADRAGRFEFACHEPGHYEKGMKGEFIVQP
ncbi:MAG: cupredoxin domain-containing protein [Firmicutes bacterium]|nr:cupredoxin domain-containing protein [Bacillota bacterium]